MDNIISGKNVIEIINIESTSSDITETQDNSKNEIRYIINDEKNENKKEEAMEELFRNIYYKKFMENNKNKSKIKINI